MRLFDLDGDGTLTFLEFAQGVGKMRRDMRNERYTKVFDALDICCNEVVTQFEIQTLLKRAHRARVFPGLKWADLKVEIAEFFDAVTPDRRIILAEFAECAERNPAFLRRLVQAVRFLGQTEPDALEKLEGVTVDDEALVLLDEEEDPPSSLPAPPRLFPRTTSMRHRRPVSPAVVRTSTSLRRMTVPDDVRR